MRIRTFLIAYGKYMVIIEALIVGSTFLSFASLAYFHHLALASFQTVVGVCFALAYAHTLICMRVSFHELFPRKSLLLEFLRRFFYKLVLIFSIPVILLVFLVLSYFPREFWYQNPLFDALSVYTEVSLGLLIIFFFYGFGLMNNRKRFRLSLRSALIGLKLISMEKDGDKRDVLVGKYIRWVKSGFHSYNRYLYKNSPMHIEIVDIDQYCHSLCCVAKTGHEEEIGLVSEQVRHALDSVGTKKFKTCDDIRKLLIRLKNIKNLERNDEYQLSELIDMTKMISRSDHARNLLSSPLAVLLIVLIPIILQALSMLKLV